MDQPLNFNDSQQLAAQINAEILALPVRNTPNVRAVRKKYSRMLKQAPPAFILDVARALLDAYDYRVLAYELIANHHVAFERLGEAEVQALGQGIDSWWSVDAFGRILSGPAWLAGQLSDELIHRWARSEDLWWRRAALVSTVALNMRSHGGQGDVPRTLGVCRVLVDDHEDMLVKALSWALRVLVVHDAGAVEAFLEEHDQALAARVKREVRNKITTGLKNPGRKGK